MTTTRRTALAMLGLGTATAVGSETFNLAPTNARQVASGAGAYDKERYAQAFENIARELRLDRVSIVSIDLHARLEADSIADIHDLKICFHYMPEAQS